MKLPLTTQQRPKVFGIGLMRTGTVSLAHALRALGLRVAHFDELRETMGTGDGWVSGDFSTDWMRDYDAALDNPVPAIFPQLDKMYPGSKFILTTREQDGWVDSCRKYLGKVPARYEYRKLVRTAMYGMYDFNEERWRYLYEKHHHDVLSYFRNRSEDLLTINIPGGDGWSKLAPFLRSPVPDQEFPTVNAFTNLVFE